MIRKIFASAHRVLGAILCLFFLMWFLSGFVMIYHSYPRVKQDRKLLAEPALTSALPADTALCGQLPDTAKLQSLSVEMRFGRPIAYMKGKGVPASRYLDNGQPEEPSTFGSPSGVTAKSCPFINTTSPTRRSTSST